VKAAVPVVAAIIAVMALLFVATRPTARPEMTEAEIAQYEAEVTQAISEQWAGYVEVHLNNDAEGVLSYWTPDMRMLGQQFDMGRTEYETQVREYFDRYEISGFDAVTYEVFVHDSAAYQIGQVDESYRSEGGEPMVFAIYMIIRWEEQPDGVWKIDRMVWAPRN
jgi:ketosteroid isomerase-like protein